MILILIGKSGSGKDTILKRLIDDRTVNKIVSYTTRPMRKGEVNGIDYNFVTESKFFEMMNEGKFFETRHYDTQLNGNHDVWHYGSELICPESRIPYGAIVDVEGARDYIRTYGKENVFVVYVDVSDSVREQRARERGSFDETEWNRRLKDDNIKFDPSIINDISDLIVNNENDIRDTIFEIVYEFYNFTMNKYKCMNHIRVEETK